PGAQRLRVCPRDAVEAEDVHTPRVCAERVLAVLADERGPAVERDRGAEALRRARCGRGELRDLDPARRAAAEDVRRALVDERLVAQVRADEREVPVERDRRSEAIARADPAREQARLLQPGAG